MYFFDLVTSIRVVQWKVCEWKPMGLARCTYFYDNETCISLVMRHVFLWSCDQYSGCPMEGLWMETNGLWPWLLQHLSHSMRLALNSKTRKDTQYIHYCKCFYTEEEEKINSVTDFYWIHICRQWFVTLAFAAPQPQYARASE